MELRSQYLFLRRIESALRRMENSAVSKLPADEREQHFLAKRLGFASGAEFLAAYRRTTRRVRSLYEKLMP